MIKTTKILILVSLLVLVLTIGYAGGLLAGRAESRATIVAQQQQLETTPPPSILQIAPATGSTSISGTIRSVSPRTLELIPTAGTPGPTVRYITIEGVAVTAVHTALLGLAVPGTVTSTTTKSDTTLRVGDRVTIGANQDISTIDQFTATSITKL
ncbi:MAG: hypothetical protein KBB55_00895 [Candidatus Buchananbacteria bacterium]|nr:hypothetical protein [Candidatus Buchananbacteria bacterium]